MKTIRVGGVPEHFNLPWILAIEEGAFADVSADVHWIDFPGGTGALMAALAEGDIDLATPLTEGAVTAIANGNPSRIVREWVDSPLLWGVHVAASSAATTIDELSGGRFAVSRRGSGSELMSLVMADDLGWQLDGESWVEVGDLAGALEALPAGRAEIFLWNKSMTQPHVDDGTLRRVGVVPTPWPSFVVAASNAILQNDADLVYGLAERAATRAHWLAADDAAADVVAERYALDRADAAEWLQQVLWTEPGTTVDVDMIQAVADRMHFLGRVGAPVDASHLVH